MKYEIRPIRLNGRIVEWVVYAPNGAIFVASSFGQAVWKMDSAAFRAKVAA